MTRHSVKNLWFVSVEMPKHRRGEQTFARQTKTFPTETEAKQFAKEMLSFKNKIVAGTLLSAYRSARLSSRVRNSIAGSRKRKANFNGAEGG